MFAKSFFIAAAACTMLASSVNAHMLITSPIPFGADSLTNSPLEADGSDFPCKQRSGVYTIGTMNQIPVGVPQKLSFKGGATHGGGSCQLSVTMDKQPTKSSKWKVIHSILGGCPNSQSGNANGGADYQGNPTFEYTMPKGMPNGEYTLAWTWFNKIGNREMYMNCAPITVTGGADNNDVLNSLPDMFVANIGNGCTTSENQDFVFPNPGLNVETVMKTALGSATSGTCATAAAGAGSGSGGSGSSPAGSSAAPTRSASSSAAAAAPTAPVYGGSSAAVQTSLATSTVNRPASSAAAPAAASSLLAGSGTVKGANSGSSGSAPAVGSSNNANTSGSSGASTGNTSNTSGSSGASTGSTSNTSGSSGASTSNNSNTSGSSGASTSNTTSSGSCSAPSLACSSNGAVVCLDGGKWGLCDRGCVFPMQLAAGTSCKGGVISKRQSMSGHVRRHLHGSHKH